MKIELEEDSFLIKCRITCNKKINVAGILKNTLYNVFKENDITTYVDYNKNVFDRGKSTFFRINSFSNSMMPINTEQTIISTFRIITEAYPEMTISDK